MAAAYGFDGPVEDFEFTLGHVTGVRGFKTDHLGRLVGVTKRKVFKPGMNIATCGTNPTDDIADHTCGYYAYFKEEGVNDPNFYNATVGAIVRGYGRTVVGPYGFRAEKADLLALFPFVNEEPEPEPEPEPKKRPKPNFFSRFYPREGWFRKRGRSDRWDVAGIISTVLLGFSLAFSIPLAIVEGSVAAALIALLTPALGALSIGYNRRMWWAGLISKVYPDDDPDLLKLQAHTRPDKEPPFNNGGVFFQTSRYGLSVVPEDPKPAEESKTFQTLKDLYPDVPVYPSLKAAIEAHPLTTVEEATPPPPTPENTDNFWDLPPDDDNTDNVIVSGTIMGSGLRSNYGVSVGNTFSSWSLNP